MELKNVELLNINSALNDLLDTKLPSGRFKFKLFKLKLTIEKALEPVVKSLEGAEQNEVEEVLSESQDLEINKLTFEELEPLEMTVKQLILLKPITEENE